MVKTLGNEITGALERLGKTQGWLAESVGVSNTAVTKWIIEGQISRINAAKVARVLGISIDQLLHGRQDSLGQRMAEPIDALPPKSQQEILDFIRYKYERAELVVANEKAAQYHQMIDRINADMERLKGADPDDDPA